MKVNPEKGFGRMKLYTCFWSFFPEPIKCTDLPEGQEPPFLAIQ